MTTNLPAEQLLELYRRMKLIRAAEEQLGADCANGKLPGPVHLYIGQEAVAVGLCGQLADKDWISSTHRGHGHFLAKGGDVATLMAEIYGRSTGICKGYGGSMHVADFGKGIMGANGIVGGGIALMTGAAFAAQLDGQGSVAVCFFGDGAANQGVLMEALNVASLWRLPLVLVCENNGFSEFSPSATVTSGDIYKRASSFGVPAERIDGNDVFAVWQAGERALRRARAGQGPSLIEASTYRIRGHVEYESTFLSQPYRSEDEVKAWIERDPIDRFRRHVLGESLVGAEDLAAIDRAVDALVADAVTFAEKSPWPEPGASSADLMFA
ncbi:MAG: thiamine pyrophosphate-dependent dehydrogenase E1 component subunit alpha [Parvibaculaceae bacterium]